ncbi:major facilitator superfamily domain-containing protein [Colletotrichum godetiae]|uniref:Major facilitator superfamily domain-containing protein n=1 Tax=Colletotrichum godetiae TaxID=1209918 RepID=A0AAJ0A9B2_9PEZI|nr:major facilitator superfamily domain-containing protein [Colletotrichum godetiae]KAK1658268.1 major facilitator superfamily domain-containing protein [Colletotrichum godetiae]
MFSIIDAKALYRQFWHLVCHQQRNRFLFTFRSCRLLTQDFFVIENTYLVLLNSLFLFGYAIGPLIMVPLSEYIGHLPVLLVAYTGSTIFTLACAVSPMYTALLIFRLLAGICSVFPNGVVPGVYADIYEDPITRGHAMAYYMAATTVGSHLGPAISGFALVVDWRVTFWIGFSLFGAGLPALFFFPETYLPVLNKSVGRQLVGPSTAVDETVYRAPLSKTGTVGGKMQVIFARPFSILVHEPIVLYTSLYVAMIYSVLYLFFQVYPIIFQGPMYGLSPGPAGLAFLPVAFGSLIALCIYLAYSSYHTRAVKAGAEWASKEENRRLPMACLGGPGIPLALFWLGWTSDIHVSPVVPMMSGVLFGVSYLLVLMSMLNYLSDAYKEFSASAQSAASTTRSICAVCLPLAAKPMHDTLGVPWACSMLGFIALAMTFIPFVFLRYGHKMRSKSPLCLDLKD